MEDSKKPRQKKTLFIIFTVLLVAVLAVFLFLNFQSEEPSEIISGGNTSSESESVHQPTTDEGQKSEDAEQTKEIKTESGNEIVVSSETVNAYDYILAIMNQPQYWSEEEYIPPYSAPWYTEEAKETLVNGTGWYLKDEETATFERGYLSKFSINFSEHTAMSVDELGSTTYYFDFENDIFWWEVAGVRSEITRPVSLKGTEWYWQSVYGMADLTFRYYEEIFEAAGCSLLNQPAGTLASYKNKKANKVTLVDDGLIHAPWEQDGFTFAWEEHADEVEWLSDYRDILNKEVPESETEPIEYCDRNNVCPTLQYSKYSPLYLVIADKNGSEEYLKQDGSVWFESLSIYTNITEALATYYLAPAMKEVYGYTGVYFVDESKLNGSHSAVSLDSKAEFLEGIYYDSSYQAILETYPTGEVTVKNGYSNSFFNTEFIHLIDDVRDIYNYYGKEYKFGEDYLGNFMLVYSIENQLILGLR